jgi:hypothetical protein
MAQSRITYLRRSKLIVSVSLPGEAWGDRQRETKQAREPGAYRSLSEMGWLAAVTLSELDVHFTPEAAATVTDRRVRFGRKADISRTDTRILPALLWAFASPTAPPETPPSRRHGARATRRRPAQCRASSAPARCAASATSPRPATPATQDPAQTVPPAPN